jgi:quercetin dioxygenase-like cupin family protein
LTPPTRAASLNPVGLSLRASPRFGGAFSGSALACNAAVNKTVGQEISMKKHLVAAAVLIAFSSSSIAQETETRVTPDTLTWKENPAFPKGVQIAILVGDPAKAGEVVVMRIKFPANFQMPPHTHPYSEVVTVISGTIGSTHGEKFEKKGEMLKPGSLWVYPAKHAHYAWTEDEEGILQVQFTGPGGIDYVNPADDPRKK